MNNLTIITQFVPMDISIFCDLQVVQGLLFLVIYLETLTGNLLTITLIVTNPRPHSPMKFFRGYLPLIDLWYISVTVSKLVVNSMSGNKTISLTAGALQIFHFILFGTRDLAFLVVMSYDCYVATCHPLHYGLTQAGGGLWASGFVSFAIHTGTIFKLPFTGSNVIYQYFCDYSQILRISSLDVWFSEFVVLPMNVCMGLICSVLLFTSYINIFLMVLSMHSMEAHNKALFTCTPQLAVLLILSISGFIAVLGPIADKASLSNLLTGMFYTIVSPLINPLIYSLWNREINTALGRMFNRCLEFPTRVICDQKIYKNKI